MSKFKVGDVVTTIYGYIGNERPYKILNYDIEKKIYKLTVPHSSRFIDIIDQAVIQADWQEHELEEYYKTKKISFGIDTSDASDDDELHKIESEEINMKNILEIYKERKRAKIDREHTEMKKTLKEQDKISQIIAETNKLIQEIEPTRVFPVISSGLYTTETLEKEKQIDEEFKQRLTELDELIEEVEGYFAMTTDFTERKAILRNYDIIDKKGKLII